MFTFANASVLMVQTSKMCPLEVHRVKKTVSFGKSMMNLYKFKKLD